MPKLSGGVLLKGGLRGILRGNIQKIANQPKVLTPTEKVLVAGLQDRWDHQKFKKRFTTANSPRRINGTRSTTIPSDRAHSTLESIDEWYTRSVDPKDRSATDSCMKSRFPDLDEPPPSSTSLEFRSPKAKPYKFVKIPKSPFGVHSPTNERCRDSPKFSDIIIKRSTAGSPDRSLSMAKHTRKMKEDYVKTKKRRSKYAEHIIEARVQLDSIKTNNELIRRRNEQVLVPPSMDRILAKIGTRNSIK